MDIYGAEPIVCTPNHRFYTTEGWVRADRLYFRDTGKHCESSHKIMVSNTVLHKEYNPIDFTERFDVEDFYITTNDNKAQLHKVVKSPYFKPFINSQSRPVNKQIETSKDFLYFIGRWIGDGSISRNIGYKQNTPHSIIQIVFNRETERKAYIRCKQIGEKAFGIPAEERENPNQNTLILRWNSGIIGEWFYNMFGKGCENKHIPSVFDGDFDITLGILDSDGCVLSHGSIKLVMKNKFLVSWIKNSLLTNGVLSLPITKTNHENTYQLVIPASQARNKLLPFMTKEYYDKRMNKTYKDTSEISFVQNVTILEQQKTKVYNLSVEDDESYCVNGVMVHNCTPSPKDSIESIYETNRKMARIFSYGGGCGVAIDNLRPKNARVNNSAKTSTGAVSFLELFNATGSIIGQEGRRSAIMVGLDCRHPDIEEFLHIKETNHKLESMNISIKFTDDFFKALQDDKPWRLHFEVPETGEKIEREINAREFFKHFCQVNADWGDPGAIFIDTVNNNHLLSGYEEYKIEISNP